MKGKMKRLIASVLSMVMLLSFGPMGALAVESTEMDDLPVEKKEYKWTFAEGLNTENQDNELKAILGEAKVQDGQLVTTGALEITNTANLSLDENWVVEWEINGQIDRHVVLSSKPQICSDGAWYIFRYDNKYFLGTWYKNGYTNFLLSADGYTEGSHAFAMKCINGVISFAVDGKTTCYDLTTADVYRATTLQTNARVLKDYRAQLNDVVFPFKYVGSTHRSEFYANDTLDSLYIKKDIIDEVEYEWIFDADLDTKSKDNELKAILGEAEVQDGQLVTTGALEMTNTANLSLDENWVVEWKIDGQIDRHVVLSSKPQICSDGAWYIFRYDNKYFLGTWYKNGYTNFLLSADGYTEGSHTFTLECINGVISFAVDGGTTCADIKNAPVYLAATQQTDASVINDCRTQLDDATFLFKYLGSTHRVEFYANNTLDSLYIKKAVNYGVHEHSYSSNNDGTHDSVCTCGESIVEDCEYGGDTFCDKCGFQKEIEVVWLNSDGTSNQTGLTYDANTKTYTGNQADYTNDVLALPLVDGAEWSLKIDLAKYKQGQIIAFNPQDIYSRVYLGTSSATSGRNDVRLGFTFDWTTPTSTSAGTGTKYYNFTWKGISENIWDGNAHTLQLNYAGGKFTLTIDDTNTYTINSIVVGNGAEILRDDTDGKISQVVVDLIKSQTGSEYLLLNGGGNINNTLSFSGVFNGVSASIKMPAGVAYDENPTPVVQGKNVHFLGSSIFYGTTGQPKGNSFVDFMARKWNITTFQKQAISGTTLAIRDNAAADKPCYCEQYANFTEKDKCDALVIQLSTNDFNETNGTAVPVGTVTQGEYDAEYFDKTTVCGAMEWLIATAKENNPNVKVVFVSTPMLNTWTNYTEYADFVKDEMQTIVAKWGIDFVDCLNYTYPWADSQDYWKASETAPTGSTYHLFYNDFHPNNVGYSLLMAPPIAEKLIDILGD